MLHLHRLNKMFGGRGPRCICHATPLHVIHAFWLLDVSWIPKYRILHHLCFFLWNSKCFWFYVKFEMLLQKLGLLRFYLSSLLCGRMTSLIINVNLLRLFVAWYLLLLGCFQNLIRLFSPIKYYMWGHYLCWMTMVFKIWQVFIHI